MAYRPGQYVREFFTSGGFTLTDKSPKYGPGKIPLFKSMSRLGKKELLYAVGYNLSTLGAFGINFAQIGAMPYYIGQYANTINSFRKNLKNPSNVLGGQIIARQKLLGGAKLIGRMRPAVSRALKTNTPIDRATNIIIGRETQAMLRQARSVGTGGVIVNLIQSVNPRTMDNQLLKQAEIPNKGNVFTKWRDRTFAEAYTNAPDPFTNNPIMQLKKAQARKEAARAKKGRQSYRYGPDDLFGSVNLQFDMPRNPINIDGVLSKLSLTDAALLADTGRGGRQKTIAEAMESAIANKKYQNDANIMGMSQAARNELYRQHEHDRVGRLVSFGAQTRTYQDRGLETSLAEARNPVIKPGERDIRTMDTTGQIDTHKLREARQTLMKDFTKSAELDLTSIPGANPTELILSKDAMDEFKNFLRAFGQPTGGLTAVKGPRQAARLLSSALTMISHSELNENIINLETQANAIDRFSNVLINQGYKNLGNQLRALYIFDRDDIKSPRPQGAYALRLAQLNRLKSMNKNSQMIDKMFILKTGGDNGIADVRFRPAGGAIESSDYIREVVIKGQSNSKLNLKEISLTQKGNASDKFLQNVLSPNVAKQDSISYVDLVAGKVPGIEITYNSKGLPVIKGVGNVAKDTRLIYGKSLAWWEDRILKLHKNYAKVARATNTLAGLNTVLNLGKMGNKNTASLLREHLAEMKKIVGNINEKHDIFELAIGEFERVGKDGKRTGFIEERGLSTIRNESVKEGKSVKFSTSHNYVPIKAHIQKSLFMHRMERKGVNENDGTEFLFRYSVSGGGRSPKSKYADAIRDIFSVEFGGPLHDRNYQLEKRTDGMFLLPSNFIGKAGTRSAAYFGIFDTGAQFKAKGPGGMGTFRMTDSIEGVKQTVSPYDAQIPGIKDLGIAKFGVRKNLRKDTDALKKTRREGIRRVIQLEKDFARVVKDKRGVLDGGGSALEARIASQRAFSLYKESGGTGLIPGRSVFEMMSGADRANLGIVGNDIADISQVRMSKLGFYGGKQRVVLGEFFDPASAVIADGVEYSHKQGSKGIAKYAANFYRNPQGGLSGGEMPVVQVTDNDIMGFSGLFRDAQGKINFNDMAHFTGIDSEVLANINKDLSARPSKIILEKLGLQLDTKLNPADNPTLKKILDSPFENFAEAFDLHKMNGPFLTNNERVRTLKSPNHPINKYKNLFLTDKVLNGLNFELQKIMKDRLSDVYRTADSGTKKILDAAIRNAALEEIYRFKSRMNQFHFKQLDWTTSESQFRQLLLSQAYSMERAKLNAAKRAYFIGGRYRKAKPPTVAEADEFFGKDTDDIPWENLHSIHTVPTQKDGVLSGYDIHILTDQSGKGVFFNKKLKTYDKNIGRGRELNNIELEMIQYYDPSAQSLRDFASMGARGVDDIKVTYGNNVLTSKTRGQFIQALQSDEVLRDYYTAQFGDDVINAFIKGRRIDGSDYASKYGNINDILKGEHAVAVTGGVATVIDTTGIQRGESIQELLVVASRTDAEIRNRAARNANEVIYGKKYRAPKKLGKDVWLGIRQQTHNIQPQNFLERLAQILNDGTMSGYFPPGKAGKRARTEFIRGVWHSAFRYRTNGKGVMYEYVGRNKHMKMTPKQPTYAYGFHSKTLDLIKDKNDIPDEVYFIINTFGLLGIDISKRTLAHNTITDLPLLNDKDFNEIANKIMELYPMATALNTGFTHAFNFVNILKRR